MIKITNNTIVLDGVLVLVDLSAVLESVTGDVATLRSKITKIELWNNDATVTVVLHTDKGIVTFMYKGTGCARVIKTYDINIENRQVGFQCN